MTALGGGGGGGGGGLRILTFESTSSTVAFILLLKAISHVAKHTKHYKNILICYNSMHGLHPNLPVVLASCYMKTKI